jgi:hypothetical protein
MGLVAYLTRDVVADRVRLGGCGSVRELPIAGDAKLPK